MKIENEELKISLNTYKEDLDKAMNGNNNNKSEKEFAINFNNLTKTFTFKDIDSNQIEENIKKKRKFSVFDHKTMNFAGNLIKNKSKE